VQRLWLLVLCGIVVSTLGCGGSHSSNVPVTVQVSPPAQFVVAGASLNLTATVTNRVDNSGVTWTLSGPGALTQPFPWSVTYTAPGNISANTSVVVTASSSFGVSGYAALTIIPFSAVPTPNVQPVTVDGGPATTKVPNRAYTSVIVCTPGTTTCSTIDGILIDTGSAGLRILSSALPSLPPVTDSSGNSLQECFQFVDQSYVWGKIASADVRIAGEVAGAVPIQAIADPSGFSIPSDCTGNGAGVNRDTLETLGANGILGVGLEAQDCGRACDPSTGGTPPSGAYYSCSGSSCTSQFALLAQQLTNPVTLFANDNNGVVLQLPSVSGEAASVSGSLIFGVGTQLNNSLGGATVFTVNSSDNFTSQLSDSDQKLTASFIDSGSNAFFFPDSGITVCSGANSSYFCPAVLTALSAVNTGANKTQGSVNFSLDNADNLFLNFPDDAALGTLGGPNGSGGCSAGVGSCSFDWGLPFFYGRSVYTSIRGRSVPLGAPAAPWWAYSTGFSGQ
jgi:hypothetical protein